MTYEKDKLISGFSENTVEAYEDINTYILRKNDKTPFQFIDDITIRYVKFVRRNPSFAYYEIITNSNGKSYVGIIDIINNRIVYNIENHFQKIKPYANTGLLLIDSSTAYRVCLSGKDQNNNCNSKCSSDEFLVLDTVNSNYCDNKYSNNNLFILKPDNIYVDKCDESIYIIQNEKECGLCKDLNENNKFKILNEKECLETAPVNTYIINDEFKIINRCHESCKTCSSDKENNCLSCYKGYIFINGKCFNTNCPRSCNDCPEESDIYNNFASCQNTKYNKKSIRITIINGCNLNSYVNISYINETEEFIVYFEVNCVINEMGNKYIFIYSFDENFKSSFFGSLRPFFLSDSVSSCFPFYSFNNIDWISNYSISFSSLVQKYILIGNNQDYDGLLIFILNKDIKIKNDQENISNFTKFICEDYQNSTNDMIENYNFIEKCSNDTNKIESSCSEINYNYKTLNINHSTKECDLISSIKTKCKMVEEEVKSMEETYQIVVNLILNNSMDSLLENLLYGDKEDIKISDDKNNEYLITSSENLKDNTKQTNTIDLGECEEVLKKNYNINANDSLIVIKMDKYNENKDSIKQVEYEIFHPLNRSLLNLSLCQNTKINIFYQLSSDKFKNTEKLNQTSAFYNDLCYTNNTNDDGIDMTVKERRKNYIPSCEENCDLIDFDIAHNKTQCSCDVKNEFKFFNIKINTQEIYKKFTEESFANINIIKCYYLLFEKENLKYNIGNYSILGIIIIYLICFIIFIFKGYNSLKRNINIFVNFIPNSKNKRYSKNAIITTSKEKEAIKKKNKRKSKNISSNSNPIKHNNMKKNKSIKVNINNFNSSSKIYKGLSTSRKSIQFSQSNINNNQVNNFNTQNINNKKEQKKIRNTAYLSINHLCKRDSEIMKMNDYEINRLEYTDALRYDKRVFFQYYWSLIKAGHIGIFAFIQNNDYNSRVIKVCLFFFSFALLFAVNSLFFTDSSMDNILINSGKFDFIFQIVQIVYSTLISSAINLMMKFLALTQQDVLILKLKRKGETLEKNLIELEKKIKIKFALFFIISFPLLIIFWFFVSCFCAVYRNTQRFLISDTLISFGLSLIFPFGKYLIPAIFRISSLRSKNRKCIYKISLFFQRL